MQGGPSLDIVPPVPCGFGKLTAMSTSVASAAALYNQGVDHLAAGNAEQAEACWRAALAQDPALAEAHANLAWLADARGEVSAAEAGYRQALALRPNLAPARLNFGGLLMNQRRLPEAEAEFTEAITLRPAEPAPWSNLGGLYAAWQRDAEAELCCRQALLREPGHAKACFNLAYVLLRQGRWEEGWPLLESRDWYAALQSRLELPRWQGEPLAGRRILVGPEAGYGDVIQFARYAPLLRQLGVGHVAVLCPPALAPLLATLEGVDAVLAWDQPAEGGWDCWVPLLSLPHLLGTRVDTVPAALPYLAVTPERRARWADRLPPASLRVGLVWRGSAQFENDAERSLPALATLAPLWQVPGIQFVSLQKGAGEDEAREPPPGQTLLHLGTQIEDFADTAALIDTMDLVISVDTSAAHLAGALGKPCWLLLPAYMTDWRWLQQREDTPWYPGVMRLFRQRQMGDWAPVVEELRRALVDWVTSGTAARRP